MPETDIPLKLLVQDFASDFAAWLLDVDITDVYDVRPLKVELPADAVRSDTVFHVVLASGQRTLLHVEFQGRRSERTAHAPAHVGLHQPLGPTGAG